MHQIEGAPLLGVGHPHDLVQFGPAVFLLERPEQAAALDAGELLVVAGEDQFGPGRPRLCRHLRQVLGRQHAGLIDDQHRAAVPAAGTALEAIELGGDRRRIAEAVPLQVLHDLVGPAHADDPVSGRLVGVAHRGERRALAGSRLAGDDREPFASVNSPEGGAPLAGDLRVPVEGGLALRRASARAGCRRPGPRRRA